jgi:putative ABC transport system permease protein
MTDNFTVEGQVIPPNQSAPLGPLVFVNETYFSTLGAPLLRGRFFSERDDDKAPEVVMINETLANQYFPGVDPVGRRLKNGGPERPIGPNNKWQTIVGVVGDINYSGLDAPPEPVVYYAFRQATTNNQYVAIRTSMNPRSLEPAVKSVVADLDKDLPIVNLRTMDELMTEAVAPPRFRTILVSMFAVVGLLLAAIGIYGVMAYAVTERTHELGVRIALGAEPGDIRRLVVREGTRLSAVGIGLGLAGALATSRTLGALLFGVSATDPATFAIAAVGLSIAGLAAAYIPARRASRIDPVVLLR